MDRSTAPALDNYGGLKTPERDVKHYFFYSFPLTVQMLVLYKHAYAVCAC